MSVPELNKTTNIQNESAYNINTNQQENTNPAIDMDPDQKETVTPGPLTVAKSKEILCIDMESGMESQVGIRDQIETEPVVNLSELTTQMINQRTARQKLSIRGLYEYMLGYGRQTQAPRLIWDRGQSPLQPEQAVWMQFGPTQIQVPSPSPHEGPTKVQGPQLTQAQGGYYQGQGYGPPQGQGYYQGQGYGPPQGYAPPQGYGPPQSYGPPQGYGPPQSQGYGGQGSGPPEDQGGNTLRGYFQPTHTTGERLVYDPASRNGFVRLVMSIVLIMLLVTAGFVAFVLMTPVLKAWFHVARWEVLIISLVCLMSANYGIMCSPCGRVCPGNVICLTLAVIGMTMISCKITCHYRTDIILYAVIATAAVVLVCIVLACTSFDFTGYALYIIAASVAFSVIVLIIYVVSAVSGQMMTPVKIGILVVGTLIQVLVLTMELQMVLGGRAIEISEDDYALAAYMLYTSIVDIFLKMVQLLGLIDK